MVQWLNQSSRLRKELKNKIDPKGMSDRFISIVEMTDDVRASSLAEVYFRLPKWVIDLDQKMDRPPNYEQDISFLWYVLTGKIRDLKK